MYVLFDGDSGHEARARINGASSKDIANAMANNAKSNRELLRYFGAPVVDFPPQSAGATLAIFDDHLESHLEAHWPEWAQSCAAVEAHAGISLRKNTYAYRTATLEALGHPPPFLLDILARAESVSLPGDPT